MYCECGCGERTKLAPKTSARKGWVKGEPVRFIAQHHARRQGPEYEVEPNTGCWLWLGACGEQGYGLKRIAPGRHQVAHRYMYEREISKIPPGRVLHHECHTPRCVNPSHLRPMTAAENVRHGRSAKLTADDVAEMRQLARAGTSRRILAARYGIASQYVSRIVNGKAWKDVVD
jgi:hypothetical protein